MLSEKIDMSVINSCCKKIYHIENDRKKKRKSFFYEKMFVWIKEDRDSVTRPKNENVEKIKKMKKMN